LGHLLEVLGQPSGLILEILLAGLLLRLLRARVLCLGGHLIVEFALLLGQVAGLLSRVLALLVLRLGGIAQLLGQLLELLGGLLAGLLSTLGCSRLGPVGCLLRGLGSRLGLLRGVGLRPLLLADLIGQVRGLLGDLLLLLRQ